MVPRFTRSTAPGVSPTDSTVLKRAPHQHAEDYCNGVGLRTEDGVAFAFWCCVIISQHRSSSQLIWSHHSQRRGDLGGLKVPVERGRVETETKHGVLVDAPISMMPWWWLVRNCMWKFGMFPNLSVGFRLPSIRALADM
ncbi:hypothetical protein IF1G_04324 [Cordyceps javanica]|uniref:Uncharacterized protein n=1 Tax=Cordyceps javanica TaxID=43265 RepID=A0A545V5U3_9HYPO|nr:hypothetical protein IF1G_04324 [Cordyceps javanica]